MSTPQPPPQPTPDPIGIGGSGIGGSGIGRGAGGGGPKQRSGCLVALYILFGVGTLVLVAGGIAAWVFFQSETGQKVLTAAKEGAEWAVEAAQAPGTVELREAGCDVAMVTRVGDMMGFITGFLPDDAAQDLAEGEVADETLVMCQVRLFSSTSDCTTYAQVYGSAVPEPPERFIVMVRSQGSREIHCQGYYAPDGSWLGRADEQDFSLQPE